MNSKTSAILRMYGTLPEGPERLKACEQLIEKLIDFGVARVQILVAEDYDCQEYYNKLSQLKEQLGLEDENLIIEKKRGNPFTDLLNFGIQNDSESGFERSLIVSTEVGRHLEKFHLELMHEGLDRDEIGVSCLAVSDLKYGGELEKSIMNGALAHTCCLRKTHILDNEVRFKSDGNDGVEEIGALIRLIELDYKIAPIRTGIEYSDFSSTQLYQQSKFPSKEIRQTNAYLLHLQQTDQITPEDFINSYRGKMSKGGYYPEKDLILRRQYSDDLKRILQTAVHQDYK